MSAYDAFELYLRAKDIVEAEELGLKDRGRMGFETATGIDPEAFALQYEHRMGSKLKKELWDKVRTATSFSLNQLNETGVITDDEYDEYTQRRYYVPQRGWKNRDLDETIYEYMRHSKGQFYETGFNPVTVEAMGRMSLSSNPLPYIQSIAHTAILISEKNKYKNKALNLVLDNIVIGRKHQLFVNHVSRSLWATGIPTLPINLHPYILNFQLMVRQWGLYMSPYLYNLSY
ncbi:MAG: hypothetical protein LBG19_03210 [Prevotellaceae bacterium]|jgi:hypothetical protein|nr:hypothetical protein [Prevotellaceae bacterium]